MATTIDSRAREKNDKDPYRLQGLEQAIYLLEELCGGTEKNTLIQKMRGDRQLVDIWMNFLQHNHWISLADHQQWVLT
jgi:hypothetical protein